VKINLAAMATKLASWSSYDFEKFHCAIASLKSPMLMLWRGGRRYVSRPDMLTRRDTDTCAFDGAYPKQDTWVLFDGGGRIVRVCGEITIGCNIHVVSSCDVCWSTSSRTCRWCDVEGCVREGGYIQHQHGKNTVINWEEVHSAAGASAPQSFRICRN